MDEMYPAYAKKQGFKPESITLSDGTKAHWVGNKDAEKVVIWFHGLSFPFPLLRFLVVLTITQAAVTPFRLTHNT